MKRFIVALLTTFIVMLPQAAFANDGKVGPNEYSQVAKDTRKAVVERVWDGKGVFVTHWYGPRGGEYIEKRYPSIYDNQWVVANYKWAGLNANNQNIWDINQKYWCSTDKCAPAW